MTALRTDSGLRNPTTGTGSSATVSRVLPDLVDRLRGIDFARITGSVARVRGVEVEIRGLRVKVGDPIEIQGDGPPRRGEVIAVTPTGGVAALFESAEGIGQGDRVAAAGSRSMVVAGEGLLGRVVDGLGRPLDGGPPITGQLLNLTEPSPSPLQRRRVEQPLAMGVRVLDLMCPAGRGQRLGIFGGSGVGKSTLLGMMARGTEADVNVVALIGERGREVREMIEDELGSEGLARSVVVVATSDQSAILRRRAAELAVRYAEYFADGGLDVMFLFDSLTRLAMAQRELGVASGEPPTSRGYTPSVFSLMAALLERTGPRANGTITSYYTVLVDGDDMNDPVADSARSILDGHIVLDRSLAHRGQYPAVDPLASLSRLADRVVSPERSRAAAVLRSAMAAAAEVRDLVEVGAYVAGTNPRADAGLMVQADIEALLAQAPNDVGRTEEAWDLALAIAERIS